MKAVGASFNKESSGLLRDWKTSNYAKVCFQCYLVEVLSRLHDVVNVSLVRLKLWT